MNDSRLNPKSCPFPKSTSWLIKNNTSPCALILSLLDQWILKLLWLHQYYYFSTVVTVICNRSPEGFSDTSELLGCLHSCVKRNPSGRRRASLRGSYHALGRWMLCFAPWTPKSYVGQWPLGAPENAFCLPNSSTRREGKQEYLEETFWRSHWWYAKAYGFLLENSTCVRYELGRSLKRSVSFTINCLQ